MQPAETPDLGLLCSNFDYCQIQFLKDFTHCQNICEKLKNVAFPSGYIVVNAPLNTQFHFITSTANEDLAPKLNASVIINRQLQIKVFILGNKISNEQYMHLLTSKSLQTVTQLANILAWCKAASDTSAFAAENCNQALHLASSILQSYVANTVETTSLAVSETSLFHFILEQLNLLQTAKHGR